MNIYGDRGNILCLKLRCEQRGIGFEVEELELGDKLKPKEYDLIFVGGAQDREQRRVAEDLLKTKGKPLKDAVERGVAVARRLRRLSADGPLLPNRRGRRTAGRRHARSAYRAPWPAGAALHRQRGCRVERHDSCRLREPRGPDTTSVSAPRRSGESSPVSAITARMAAKALTTGTFSAPTCTVRCYPRTRSSPTT